MTLPIAPVSSLKLIGVLISDLNVHKHLINFGNIFWHKFNKQTVTYLVRVVTDLVHLLISYFAHIAKVVCFLAF